MRRTPSCVTRCSSGTIAARRPPHRLLQQLHLRRFADRLPRRDCRQPHLPLPHPLPPNHRWHRHALEPRRGWQGRRPRPRTCPCEVEGDAWRHRLRPASRQQHRERADAPSGRTERSFARRVLLRDERRALLREEHRARAGRRAGRHHSQRRLPTRTPTGTFPTASAPSFRREENAASTSRLPAPAHGSPLFLPSATATWTRGGRRSKGAELLRQYLEYAASGGTDLGSGVSDTPLNPFELSIKEGLERRGIPVTPQYGVSGYRIDFACAHPDENGTHGPGH